MPIIQHNEVLSPLDPFGNRIDIAQIAREISQEIYCDPIKFAVDDNLAENLFRKRFGDVAQRSLEHDSLRFSVSWNNYELRMIRETIDADISRGNFERIEAILLRGNAQVVMKAILPLLCARVEDKKLVELLRKIPQTGKAASILMHVLEYTKPEKAAAIRERIAVIGRPDNESKDDRRARLLLEFLEVSDALQRLGRTPLHIRSFFKKIDMLETFLQKRKKLLSAAEMKTFNKYEPSCFLEFNRDGSLNGISCEETYTPSLMTEQAPAIIEEITADEGKEISPQENDSNPMPTANSIDDLAFISDSDDNEKPIPSQMTSTPSH